LREEYMLKVFENRVLLRIFGPERDEVTGEWRRLHNEELHNLYCSPNIFSGDQIKKNEMGRECGTYGRHSCIQDFGGGSSWEWMGG
jgi:hypothetical protein